MKLTDEQKRENKKARLVARFAAMSDKGKGEALRDFQKLVRLRYANNDGHTRCVTCKRWKHWKEMDGGHFISRKHNSTCFDERNVHPQCKWCNMGHNKDAQANYLEFMQKHFGPDVVGYLRRTQSDVVSRTKEDYAELCLRFRDEIKLHLMRMGEG